MLVLSWRIQVYGTLDYVDICLSLLNDGSRTSSDSMSAPIIHVYIHWGYSRQIEVGSWVLQVSGTGLTARLARYVIWCVISLVQMCIYHWQVAPTAQTGPAGPMHAYMGSNQLS